THSGTGTTTLYTGIRLNNTGTVNVAGGTLSVLHVNQVSTTTKTLTGGMWHVGANGTLTLKNKTTRLTTNHASRTLSGVNSVFTNLSALATNNGSFQLEDGRSFTTAGAFTNAGTLGIDATSKLAVMGDFTQTATGTLDVETGSGTWSDRLTATGI